MSNFNIFLYKLKKITFRKIFNFLNEKIKNIHPLFNVLDYNTNWKINPNKLKLFMGDEILQVIDIGGAGLSLNEINNFSESVDYFCFDANVEEINKLKFKNELKKFNNFNAFPYFIGKDQDTIDFHLFNSRGLSSKFNLNKYYKDNFLKGVELEKIVSLKTISLDKISQKHNLNPDFIKLDTQGTEFEILKFAGSSLNECLMIESEVEIIQIYENQPLFYDISQFLYSKGYQLFYLNRVFSQKNKCLRPCRGQMTFGDALFGMKIEKAKELPLSKQIKYCVLLINYGLIDSAIELHDSNLNIRVGNPELGRYLNKFRKKSRLSFLKGALINWIFILILKIIKTNGLITDSDRSWNIR